ncbi:Y-box-binding protein 1-like [Pongo pygmaeus]|uniref:Y-box-binding protein 1-like n=1 Tax=Pongo pygmaeus TaxID=9600 RepID=UPI0023E32B28|nr:Y-box-binding protein 1-like [Pongo pygmaeus]
MSPRKMFVHQTAVKENPREDPGGGGAGEAVESDVEGEKGEAPADVPGPGGAQVKAVNLRPRNHYRRGSSPQSPAESPESSVGNRRRDETALPQARPHHAGPTAESHFPPWRPQFSSLRGGRAQRCRGDRCRGDSTGSGETSEAASVPGTQTTIPQGPPHPRQPGEDSDEEDKDNPGDETQGHQPPQHRAATTSITDAVTQKTLNHNMAKTQKQLIHQLRIPGSRLSKCRLLPLPSPGLVIKQELGNSSDKK